MNLKDLKADLEEHDITYKGLCHDCSTHVSIDAKVAEDGAITIEGGAVYKVKQGLEDLLYFKCDKCYKKNNILTNFVDCLVYSRVVGYLRPISGWNKGKLEEFKQRKLFINTKGR